MSLPNASARGSEVSGPVAMMVVASGSGAATSSRMISISGSAVQDPGDIGGELPPVHRQGLARRHPGSCGRGHNQGIKPPHLLLEQPHGALAAVGPQRVAAHQLPQQRRLVGRREFLGLHLIETDPDPPAGRLPGRLTPRQPPADNGEAPVFGFRFSVFGGHVFWKETIMERTLLHRDAVRIVICP